MVVTTALLILSGAQMQDSPLRLITAVPTFGDVPDAAPPELLTAVPPLTESAPAPLALDLVTTAPPLTAYSAAPTAGGEACAALPALAPTPVQVVLPRSSGDAVIKVDDEGRVYLRSEDAGPLGLPSTCRAPEYQLVTWPATFDPQNLILTVTPPADHYGQRAENAAVPSPRVSAATVGVQAALSSDAAAPLRAAVAVQADAQTGPVGATVAVEGEVHTTPGAARTVAGRAAVSAAYLTVQDGDLNLQAGLVNVARPLLGVAIGRAPAGPLARPLRVQTAIGGPYTLRFGPRVLRQGYLEPGITELDGLGLPGGEYVLTLTIDEAGVRRVQELPYAAPGEVAVGDVSYQVAVGVRPARTSVATGQTLPRQDVRPAADATVRYQVTPDAAVRARASLGPDPEIALGASVTPTPTSQALLEARVRRDSGAGTTTLDSAAVLSAQAEWGTWSTGVGIGYAQADGGSGAASMNVNFGATVQGVTVQAGSGIQNGQPYGTLGVGGTFSAGTYDVHGRASPGRARVDVSLNLRPGEGWQVLGGVIGGQPQLAARRDLDLRAWAEQRQLPPVQGSVTARVLPTPGVTLDVGGPVTASAAVSLAPGGAAPTVNVAVGARWGVVAGAGALVSPIPGRLLAVRVGVPGVRVGAGGYSAWTGPEGQAVLSVGGVEVGGAVTVEVDERTLPISASLSRLNMRVSGDGRALAWLADFTPYLERNALRRLTGRTFPPGTHARAGDGESQVSAAGYFALPAQPGDVVTVTWPGGTCAATYSLAEELPCR
ncbi:hypothetical protein GCM10017781_16380 [Deinococcus metalli]|uniref:Fimbrial biogenesis outer membrane usher protein n=1 Tax=Deinococcus metalli TaxID=1141878 RepID=A0ABQ3JKQ6_9DEIO|nr:hypothetical protein GCM10017781_16380 [Deinococcus metalli]